MRLSNRKNSEREVSTWKKGCDAAVLAVLVYLLLALLIVALMTLINYLNKLL